MPVVSSFSFSLIFFPESLFFFVVIVVLFCFFMQRKFLKFTNFLPYCLISLFIVLLLAVPRIFYARSCNSGISCIIEACICMPFYLSFKVHLKSCPLKVVSCTNKSCDDTMTRNNLQAHVTTTCPWRILRCNHCGFSYPACRIEVNMKIYYHKIIRNESL